MLTKQLTPRFNKPRGPWYTNKIVVSTQPIVFRLSRTGTAGATLRVYLETYVSEPDRLELDPQQALAPLIATADALAQIRSTTGLVGPDVVT